MTKHDLISIKKAIKSLKKEYGVDIVTRRGKAGGFVRPWESFICIKYSPRHSVDMVMSILFHEIAHVMCYRSGVYKVYNSNIWNIDLPTDKQIKIFTHTALKAERYADRLGEKLLKQHYPHMRYYAFYDTKLGIETNKTVVSIMLKRWAENKKMIMHDRKRKGRHEPN